ncbi:MAG: hypothetical protein H0U75_07705 [Legionella sp.]|nr:hypothetical protein [Legionella sp.]
MCDEEFGRKFRAHQLNKGVILESKKRVNVSLGFQPKICPECNNQPPVAAPKKSMKGATSKILRYYWREIYFETTKCFFNLHPEIDPNDKLSSDLEDERKKIKKEVIAKIKTNHNLKAKYQYTEQSQSQIIKRTNTEVILINAEYVNRELPKAQIKVGNNYFDVDQFGINYFRSKGFEALKVESIPFHVIFGVFMWPVIQDQYDENIKLVSFGNRADFDIGIKQSRSIETILPQDFGRPNYYFRRKKIIYQYISKLDKLNELFDLWLVQSDPFRQYLWAH